MSNGPNCLSDIIGVLEEIRDAIDPVTAIQIADWSVVVSRGTSEPTFINFSNPLYTVLPIAPLAGDLPWTPIYLVQAQMSIEITSDTAVAGGNPWRFSLPVLFPAATPGKPVIGAGKVYRSDLGAWQVVQIVAPLEDEGEMQLNAVADTLGITPNIQITTGTKISVVLSYIGGGA